MDVAVLGLGLIGGSLLRALTRDGHRTTGYDADPATRTAARDAVGNPVGGGPAGSEPTGSEPADGRTGRGSDTTGGWRVVGSVEEAVRRAELVVLAVPLPAVPGVLDQLAGAGYRGLVTDVTSVKDPVRAMVARHLDGHGRPLARYVGGHPMAGRETSGFAAAEADLFAGCAWVLCLEPERTALPDWLDLAALVTRLGARVVPATAAEHDRAVATVSHVPHLLAVALAAAATDPLAAALAAGSFRDGTRVAATRPDLIAAMCGGNAPAVGPALDAVRDALAAARTALDEPDPIGALRAWALPGSAARAGWPPTPGSTVELPARVDDLLALGRAGGWVTGVADDRGSVTAVRPG